MHFDTGHISDENKARNGPFLCNSLLIQARIDLVYKNFDEKYSRCSFHEVFKFYQNVCLLHPYDITSNRQVLDKILLV